MDQRSGEGRGKALDEGSTGPIVVENFGKGKYVHMPYVYV
jgi:hypothetical protein